MGARTNRRGSFAQPLLWVCLFVVFGLAAPAHAQDGPDPSDATEPRHPHGTGTAPDQARLDELQAKVDAAGAERDRAKTLVTDARSRLGELNDRQRQIERQLHDLNDREANAANKVAVARRHAREFAVAAYIGGGPPSIASYVLDVRDANDLAWRDYMIHDHVGRAYQSLDDLTVARRGVEKDVDDLARVLDDNRSTRQDAQNDLQRAEDLVVRSEDELADAKQDLRDADEASLAEPSLGFRGAGSDGSPTPDDSGNAVGPGWDGLRRCESGGNYNSVSSDGTYRGAYQFDLSTWRSNGGHGDPIDATTAEQDRRAQLLYDRRGAQPWPICGRYLIDWENQKREATSTSSTSTSSTSSSTTTSSSPR